MIYHGEEQKMIGHQKMQRLGLLPQGRNEVLMSSVRDDLRDLALGSRNLLLGTLQHSGFG